MFSFKRDQPHDQPEQAPAPALEAPEPTRDLPAGYPILASGSAHPAVLQIIAKLHQLGADHLPYQQEVTPDLLSALNQWREHESITDDPAEHVGFPASAVIGTTTWRAILATDQPADDAPKPDADADTASVGEWGPSGTGTEEPT